MKGVHQSSKLGVLEAHGQGRALDLAQPDRPEQLDKVALPRSGERRFVVDVRIELTRCLPEEAQRTLPAGVIPDAGGHHAAPARDARHLGEPGEGVGHEMHRELGEDGVEHPIRERQLLRGREADVNAGVARSRRLDERWRWVDGGHGIGAEALHQLRRQRPGTAADVERLLSVVDPRELGHLR